MYKCKVKVHIEDNNNYEKNRNTLQLLPENVDGFRHLTKNISVISIAICISRVGHTRGINYIVGLNISVFTLTCSAVRSLTDTAHNIVSSNNRHCLQFGVSRVVTSQFSKLWTVGACVLTNQNINLGSKFNLESALVNMVCCKTFCKLIPQCHAYAINTCIF